MTYIPPRELLRGLSLDVAECYGKPHIGCFYRNNSVKSHTRNDDARCVICGRQATNAHHQPPLSKGGFLLHGYELRPSLIALCGSGTTGCHNDFHGGSRYEIRWVWESDKFAQMWWEGDLFEKGVRPHDKQLYLLGHWEITDKRTGERIVVDQ